MKTQYPIFRKDLAYHYKILNKDFVISVYNNVYDGACSINCMDNDIIVNRLIKEGKPDISEAEFLEAYYQVRKRLNQLCDINFVLL